MVADTALTAPDPTISTGVMSGVASSGNIVQAQTNLAVTSGGRSPASTGIVTTTGTASSGASSPPSSLPASSSASDSASLAPTSSPSSTSNATVASATQVILPVVLPPAAPTAAVVSDIQAITQQVLQSNPASALSAPDVQELSQSGVITASDATALSAWISTSN